MDPLMKSLLAWIILIYIILMFKKKVAEANLRVS
jgi:hypothetical protein